jgi:hypothetical protein
VSDYDFPDDLVAAQRAIREVRAELTDLYGQLPHYTEPVAAFTDSRGEVRPASSGSWSEEDWAAVATLRQQELELATTIVMHPYFEALEGPARAEAARPSSTPTIGTPWPAASRRSRHAPSGPEERSGGSSPSPGLGPS